MHLHDFNQQNPRNLVRRYEQKENKEVYSVHLDDEHFTLDPGAPIEFPFNCNHGNIFYFKIVGCCNGVVCLSNNNCGSRIDKIFLWNPSIRRKLALIPPIFGNGREWFIVFGFGYDRMSADYKLVRLAYDDRSFIPQVQIYTVKTAIWRALGFPNQFPWVPIYVHWIAMETGPWYSCLSIMTFDMSTEVFGLMQLPNDLVEVSWERLVVTVVGESLAVIWSCHSSEPIVKSSCYKLWVMKEYMNPASWTSVYNMRYPSMDVGRALQFRNNDVLITESNDGDMIIYNNDACIYLCDYCRGNTVAGSTFVDRYQESLALLDVGHNDRIEDLRDEVLEIEDWFGKGYMPSSF